jgi:PAS domain S-box-containing protein
MTPEDNEDKLLRSVALQNAECIRIARQRAEEQTEATVWEQSLLLNLTHDAIFVRDIHGSIKYWNRAAQELYGWRAEETIGKITYDVLKTIYPQKRMVHRLLLRAGGPWGHTNKMHPLPSWRLTTT